HARQDGDDIWSFEDVQRDGLALGLRDRRKGYHKRGKKGSRLHHSLRTHSAAEGGCRGIETTAVILRQSREELPEEARFHREIPEGHRVRPRGAGGCLLRPCEFQRAEQEG